MPVTEPNLALRFNLNHEEEASIVLIPANVKQFSLAAFPGAGGDIAVEFTLSPRSSLKAELDYEGEYEDEVLWLAWEHGATVNSDKFYQFVTPVTALRLKANTSPGVVELLGNAPGA